MAMILYISAVGFVGSALFAYSGGLLTGENGSYQLSFNSISAVVFGFAICMFAGPFVTAEQCLNYWKEGYLSGKAFSFGLVVSFIWSFCSGVLFMLFLANLGVVVI